MYMYVKKNYESICCHYLLLFKHVSELQLNYAKSVNNPKWSGKNNDSVLEVKLTGKKIFSMNNKLLSILLRKVKVELILFLIKELIKYRENMLQTV